MRVLPKVTVNAVHSFFQMDVIEVNDFVESIRIVGRNNRIPGVKQVPFPVAFEDFAEQPAMAVKVGELRALELAVEFGRAGLV